MRGGGGGGHVWQGHVWYSEGVCSKGVCMAGGMHGRGGGGHAYRKTATEAGLTHPTGMQIFGKLKCSFSML